MKLKKELKKDELRRLKEDNFRYVTWIKDLVNIVHNSDIALNQLTKALGSKPGDEVLLEMERVDQLKSVYKEVLSTFTYDGDSNSEEVSNEEA